MQHDLSNFYTEYERDDEVYVIWNRVVIAADDLSKLGRTQLVVLSDFVLQDCPDRMDLHSVIKNRYDQFEETLGKIGEKSSLIRYLYDWRSNQPHPRDIASPHMVNHNNVIFVTTNYTEASILRFSKEDRSHILMNGSTHCIFHIDKGVFKLVELPKAEAITVGGLPHCLDKLKELML